MQFRLLSLLWNNLQNNLKAIIFFIIFAVVCFSSFNDEVGSIALRSLFMQSLERKVLKTTPKELFSRNNNWWVGTRCVANRLFPFLTALIYIYFFVSNEKNLSETLSLTTLHAKHSWHSIFKWHYSFHLAAVVSVLPMPAHSHIANISCITNLRILQLLNMDHLKMSCCAMAQSFIEITNTIKWKRIQVNRP